MKFNANYQKLKESYLFSDIAHRVNAYTAAHPDQKVLRMGIGDVTLPLAPAVAALPAVNRSTPRLAAALSAGRHFLPTTPTTT